MLVKNQVKAVKEVKSFGRINVNSKDVPGVKDLTIGQKVTITIDVEITGLRKPDRWEISNKEILPTDVKVDMEIRKVVLPTKTPKAK